MSILAPGDVETHFPAAPRPVLTTMREILEIHAETMASIVDLDPESDLHKRIRRFETVRPDGRLVRRLFANAQTFDDPLMILGEAVFHIGTVEWGSTNVASSPDIKREENIFINDDVFHLERRSGIGTLEERYGKHFSSISGSRIVGVHRTHLSESTTRLPNRYALGDGRRSGIEKLSNESLASLLVRFRDRLTQASKLHSKFRSQTLDLVT